MSLEAVARRDQFTVGTERRQGLECSPSLTVQRGMSNALTDSGHLVNDYDHRFAVTVAFDSEHPKRVAVGCKSNYPELWLSNNYGRRMISITGHFLCYALGWGQELRIG